MATTNSTYRTRLEVSKEFREAVLTPAKDDLATGGKILVNTRSTKAQLLSSAIIILAIFGVLTFFTLRQGDADGYEVSLLLLAICIFVAAVFINKYRSRILLTSTGITQEVRWPLGSKTLNWQDIVRVEYESTGYGASRSLIFTDRNRQKIQLNIYSEGLKDLVDYMRRYLDLETYISVLWLVHYVRYIFDPEGYEEEEAARTSVEKEKTKQVAKAYNERALKTSAVLIRWLLGIGLPVNLVLLALMWWKKIDLFNISFICTILIGFALYASTRHPGTSRDKTIRWLLFVTVTLGLLTADIIIARSVL